MSERMVIGYEGGLAGRDAVALAAKLAMAGAYELTIAYPFHPLLSMHAADTVEERVRREVEPFLGADRHFGTARFRWSNASWPVRALHELASFEGADLIVFEHPRAAVVSRDPDLMARMVHGAPCAVAVAPEGYADREHAAVRRIGAGYVDTPEGHAAAVMACTLAARADGEITLATGSALSPGLASYGAASPELPRVEEERYEDAAAALEHAADELGRPRRLKLSVRREQPADLLVEASKHLDLLVLGSRGFGPVRHALLGGVSASVMRRAHCPVMVLARGIASPPRASAHADPVAPARV